MESIILAVLIVGLIGLAFGLLLAFASVIFKVEVDERIDRITEILPGANCGACGYAGCSAYAKSVVEDNAPVNACSVGKDKVAEQIADIMGKVAEKSVPMTARVLCGGDCENAKDKYEYYGVKDCNAVNKLAGGHKACSNGCLGLGSCVSVCQFGAISIENGIAVVDEDKCTACGMCTKVCPKNVIKIMPKDKNVFVRCNSNKSGKIVNTVCKVGCIACKICEKACPFEAITVSDNLAKIDYDKCKSCGICVEKCPKKAICK